MNNKLLTIFEIKYIYIRRMPMGLISFYNTLYDR